jgi:hypothetical protein
MELRVELIWVNVVSSGRGGHEGQRRRSQAMLPLSKVFATWERKA